MSFFFIQWPHRPDGYRVQHDWRSAIKTARGMARRFRRPIPIRVPGRTPPGTIGLVPGRTVAIVRPSGHVDTRQGMGDMLTDWACDSEEFATRWRQRLNNSLDNGAYAAAAGGAIGGVIGGVLKRPFLAAVAGAALGWGTHYLWTAPQRVG